MKYDSDNLYSLIDKLAYLTPVQGHHTYGFCGDGCCSVARGGGTCENCIVDAIDDPVLKELALLFLDARRLQTEIASRMHQTVERER